jgi:beta-lactamase class A
VVIPLKSDQDQSQGLKKEKTGLFSRGDRNLGDRNVVSSDRQRKAKDKSLKETKNETNQNNSSKRRLSRQKAVNPSRENPQQANSSMRPVKPSSNSPTSDKNINDKNINKEKDQLNLFNFSSRRSPSSRQNKTDNPTSISPEIRKKSLSSRRQRRQKTKTLETIPLKPVQNNILKHPKASRSHSSIQLPSTPSPSPQGGTAQKKTLRKTRKKPPSLLMYIIRLLILGVGIGAIIGTVLSIFDSNHNILTGEPLTRKLDGKTAQGNGLKPPSLDQEIIPLKEELKSLTDQYTDLNAGIFMVDLDSQNYIDTQAGVTFSAASTIKIPILIAFFEDVDQGKIALDEKLIMEAEVVGGGSGDMQYQSVGTTFTALETATKMIVISDNTATNMIIKRLGGKDELNKRFQQWGLTASVIQNYLPDLEGTNTTSPRDLGTILSLINQGDILSLRSRDRVFEIMRQTKTRTLLPQGLGEGAGIAHKTGDIGSVLGDAGIIDMPNGKRYIATVLVNRPHNDIRGRTLIQDISRTIYSYLEKNPENPTPIPTPSPNPTTSQE